MTTLSDRDIRHALDHGLGIEPFELAQLQPASYDVRLAPEFLVPANVAYGERISIDREQRRFPRMIKFAERDRPFVLHPGCFCLGATYEVLTIPNGLVAKLDGKSTLGRLGLLVHCTAGYIDPGFSGPVTLELFNCAPYPIELVAGCPIAQVRFERLSSPAARVYGSPGLGSHYADAAQVDGPQEPQL